MKLLNLFPVLLPVLMTSCLEIDTTTRIHPDGRVERAIELKGSATSISETSFNIPRVDAHLWQITQDSIRDDKFHYQARRKFETVDEMNASFEANTSPVHVKIKSELIQSQGLFFTRYYYQEKLWADLPGPNIPMEEYLSEDELQKLILNDTDAGEGLLDSLDEQRLEEQLDRYFQYRIFEDFVEELKAGAQGSGVSQKLNEVLETERDSLVLKLRNTNYYNENLVWKSILKDYFDPGMLELIQENNSEGLNRFYQRWQFLEDVLLNDYSFSVELPGVLRKTTAPDVRGNRMTWEPDAMLLFFGGVQLSAESSIVKIWSVVITGLLFLLTLVITIMSFIRQRNPQPPTPNP